MKTTGSVIDASTAAMERNIIQWHDMWIQMVEYKNVCYVMLFDDPRWSLPTALSGLFLQIATNWKERNSLKSTVTMTLNLIKDFTWSIVSLVGNGFFSTVSVCFNEWRLKPSIPSINSTCDFSCWIAVWERYRGGMTSSLSSYR